jgi:hypothetical protein
VYDGWLAFGGASIDEHAAMKEMVNSRRLLQYVTTWNEYARFAGNEPCIEWLGECESCPGLDRFLNQRNLPFAQRTGYCMVEYDPAPWYDPANPEDSRRFLGVMGLEVKGAEDSRYTGDTLATLDGGGVVSRMRPSPRVMVVRAMLVAVTEAALRVGLAWLRNQAVSTGTDCRAGRLWCLDACPEQAATYEYDRCAPPPGGAPNPEQVFLPYLRSFVNCRVSEGPTLLREWHMPSGGWMAEVEMVITAADQARYQMPYLLTHSMPLKGTVLYIDPATTPPPTNPFALTPPVTAAAPGQRWQRMTQSLGQYPHAAAASTTYMYEVRSSAEVTDLRLLVESPTGVVDGVIVPRMPAGGVLLVDGAARSVLAGDGTVMDIRLDTVHDRTGIPMKRWVDAPLFGAGYRLHVDYPDGQNVPPGAVTVTLAAVDKS